MHLRLLVSLLKSLNIEGATSTATSTLDGCTVYYYCIKGFGDYVRGRMVSHCKEESFWYSF